MKMTDKEKYVQIEPRYQMLLFIFNDRQRKDLRRLILGEKYQIAFDVACMAGLRESEVACLNYHRGDIDFRNNMIKVYEGSKYSKNREVPIHPTLKKILKDYIRRNYKQIKKAKGYIFPTQKSLHASPNSIRIAYQKAYDKSPYKHTEKWNSKGRLRHWKFHTCRHYFASKCIDTGCDIEELSKILGHNDVMTTLMVYGHLFKSAKQAKYKVIRKVRF